MSWRDTPAAAASSAIVTPLVPRARTSCRAALLVLDRCRCGGRFRDVVDEHLRGGRVRRCRSAQDDRRDSHRVRGAAGADRWADGAGSHLCHAGVASGAGGGGAAWGFGAGHVLAVGAEPATVGGGGFGRHGGGRDGG